MVIWPWPWIFKVKCWKCCISGMGRPIDMEQKGCESIGCLTYILTWTVPPDLDPWFSRSNFEKVVTQEWDAQLTWNKRDVSRLNVEPLLWLSTWTSPMTLTLDFQGQIFNSHILGMGRSIDLERMKEMWVKYNIGCTMGLLLGHGTWQIDWPSNGSMWNSYGFQPIGPWMGYSFTDLGAGECCH